MIFYFLLTIITQLVSPPFSLHEGDLLFQDSDCGSFCDAIEKVTEGYEGANLSHVGIVIRDEDRTLKVIEAIGTGVVLTEIDTFLARSHDTEGQSKVIVGRLQERHQSMIPLAIKHAKSLLGSAYDEVFDLQNDTYYCSELVYESFKSANLGKSIFKTYPMTFIDPDTQKTFGIWTEYYKELGKPIPENEPDQKGISHC